MKSMNRDSTTVKPPVAPAEDTPRHYSVPALEKGLDVLEFLAKAETPLSLTTIAQSMSRSPGELFRILSCLSGRSWITRIEDSDSYQLSLRLYELANIFPPIKRLTDAALPILSALAHETQQSCHISIAHQGELMVVQEVEGPGTTGVYVRQGSLFGLSTTASGRVLLAFQDDATARRWLAMGKGKMVDRRRGVQDLDAQLRQIRAQGYEEVAGEWLGGVVDLAYPIYGAEGTAQAALAMPYVGIYAHEVGLAEVRKRMQQAAAAITHAIGGIDTGRF